MIKYKLKNQGIDVIDTILSNRNLTTENIRKLLSPSKKYEEDASNYKNIDRAVQRYQQAIREGETIATLVDEDLDGFTSSTVIYNFTTTEMKHSNMFYIMQKKAKVHGLNDHVIKEVKNKGVKLLITPDSSSSDYEYHKKLNEMGVDLIILDHHQFNLEDVHESAIIVNNQDGIVNNKCLSGCGVTYKFIKYVAKSLNIDLGVKYLDLVALSLIGDIMDMRSLENRYFFNIGNKIDNLTNPFIKTFVELKNIEDYLSIEELGFNISPLVNATIRLGSGTEKDIMFRSLLDRNEKIESKKRGVTKGALIPIAEESIRIATNLKRKQDKLRDNSVEQFISTYGYEIDDKIILKDVTDVVDAEITGLVANKLTDVYKRPCILVRENKKTDTLTGSARSYNREEFNNLKQTCLNTGAFSKARGHEGSFGVEISKENIPLAIEKINEVLSDIEIAKVYEVEEMYSGIVPMSDVKDIGNYENLWCNHIKEPLFLVKNVKMKTSQIEKIGNSTYIFKIGDVNFTKTFGSGVWYKSLIHEDELPFGGAIIADIVFSIRKNKKGYNFCKIIDMKTKINEEDVIDF